jgi:hypothetical protein
MSTEAPLSPTQTDVELALAFYSVLVEVARRREEKLTYGRLVELAKSQFPTNEVVQRAIPIGVGRRLDFVRAFTEQRGLPDLSSLVVNKSTNECGVGFTRNFDPASVRAEVFAFDWSGVAKEFTGVLATARKQAAKPKQVTAETAAKLMYSYFTQHKAALPSSVKDHREKIIKLIMQGASPADAFEEAMRGDA